MNDWIEIPGESGFREPECWGLDSYEHYKGQCRHQLEDQLRVEAEALSAEAEASAEAMDAWEAGH